MEKTKEILTESFRKTIEEYFQQIDAAMDVQLSKVAAEKKETELFNFLEDYQQEKSVLIQQWENIPLEALDGKTPAQVISDMVTLEDVLDVFSHMAQHADEEVPTILTEKLHTFGTDAIEKLTQFAQDKLRAEDSATYEFAAAVAALGAIALKGCVPALIDLSFQVQQHAPMLEHIEEALKKIGPDVIQPILDTLQDIPNGKAEKMLLYVLACAASEAKEERVYQKLRSSFRGMDDTLHAALCISVYGDGRAVALLRGFLQKNLQTLPKNVFYEILGAIRNLGGETEDFIQK